MLARWKITIIGSLLLNAALIVLVVYLGSVGEVPSIKVIDRATYLDISLSILNLMIALFAILLAVAAFWGYASLRDAARRRAEEVADQVAREVAQSYVEGSGSDDVLEQIARLVETRGERNKNKGGGKKRPPVSRPSAAGKEGSEI